MPVAVHSTEGLGRILGLMQPPGGCGVAAWTNDAPAQHHHELGICSRRPTAAIRSCRGLHWLEAQGEQGFVSRPPQDGRPEAEEPKDRDEPPARTLNMQNRSGSATLAPSLSVRLAALEWLTSLSTRQRGARMSYGLKRNATTVLAQTVPCVALTFELRGPTPGRRLAREAER